MTADKKFKRLVRDRARRTGESYASARHELLRKRSEDPMNESNTGREDSPVEVTVAAVRIDPTGTSPFLVLQDATSRQLPIYIGAPEATAIAFALEQVAHDRPMTHDALKETLDALGGRLLRIVIGFQPEMNTFTADVVLGMADGTERHLDWRVSDSIAVAVRCFPRPQILVPESILAEPPPSIVRGTEVRCPCGEGFPIAEDIIEAAAASGGHVDTEVECPSCGLRRHVRFEAPRGFGGP